MTTNTPKKESIILEEIYEPTIYSDTMKQKLDHKKGFILPREIHHKQTQVNRMFNKGFGKYFLNIKPEALNIFEKQMRIHFFSRKSKFLLGYPRIHNLLYGDKKINYDELKQKINMGNLLYLSDSKKKSKQERLCTKTKEKLITISKNFSSKNAKDVVTSEFYKVKFWEKNSKRVNQILTKKSHKDFFDWQKIKEEESSYENDDISKNSNNFSFKTPPKNYDIKIVYTEPNNNKIIESNKSILRNKYNNYNTENSIDIENYCSKEKDIENKKLLNIKYYESFAKNNIPKKPRNLKIGKNTKKNLNFLTLGEDGYLISNNIKNNFEEKNTFDNINKIGISTDDNQQCLSKTMHDFSRNAKQLQKLQNSSIRLNTVSNFYNRKNFLNSEKIFQKTNKRYQTNINQYVKGLKNQTKRCNTQLVKLINFNTPQRPEKIKIKIENDFDINKDIIDKPKKIVRRKKRRNLSSLAQIKSLITEAKNDYLGENFIEKVRKQELKCFPKKLHYIDDNYALRLVDKLYSASRIKHEKTAFIKVNFKEEKEKIRKERLSKLREKLEDNYLKMIKKGNFYNLEKEKFLKMNNERRMKNYSENNKKMKKKSTFRTKSKKKPY